MHGEPEWSLTDEQFALFIRNQPLIEAWQKSDNPILSTAIHHLATSIEFKALFAPMGFDEAYDRYECALEYETEKE